MAGIPAGTLVAAGIGPYASTSDRGASRTSVRFGERVTVDYGPVPGGAAERHGRLPEGKRDGLARVTCDGRETVFYGRVNGAPAVNKAAVERSFEKFVASVGHRVGCRTEGKA
ncbi:hypothetical protein [Streptomyces sp. NPDC029526]|uniref:hypothetical protein n=1 Tax=Streptomyces sp. NPDC029526 TaxID=3155728 RepID=UPI0033F7B1EF